MGSSFYSGSGLTPTQQDSIESSVSNASASEAAAEASKVAAQTAEANAESAKTASETAQAAAEAALDSFTDIYLGAKATDPALDNDGNALQDGALVFNTTENAVKAYDLGNTTWKAIALSASDSTNLANVSGQISPTNNLATVAGDSAAISTVAGISSDVSTVASDSTDISTVAGISANVTTVAGISSDVTSVAADATDIGTVAGISSDVSTVAGDSTNIGTVATNISNVNAVAGNATNINTVAADGTDIGTVAGISSDISTVAADGADIGTVAGISSDVTTVAGISANTTTVAGISSDVTSVAGVSSDVTTVAGQINNNNLQTIASDINAVITTANDLNEVTSEIDTVANAITNVDNVGNNIANVNQVATDSSDINTLAAITSDIQTLADIEDGTTATNAIQTAASNVTDINTFVNRYRIGSTNPSTDNDEGDLFFNTTTNTMLVFNTGVWNEVGSNAPATTNVFEFTATAGQTVFTGSDSNSVTLDYNTSGFFVALNGVIIPPEDYTATSSSTLTLDTATEVGDTVTIYSFSSFTVSQPFATAASVSTQISTALNDTVANSIGDITIAPVNTSSNNERGLQIKSTTDNTTEQPALSLFRDSATPADNDYIGKVGFYGRDSGGGQAEYAKIRTRILETNQADRGAEIELQAKSQSGGYRSMVFDARNNQLRFNHESTLYWPSHKGTAHNCTLDWDTPSQDTTITLPNASGHLGWIAIDRQTGVSASDINMAMSDEYEMHMFNISVHPSTSANFRVRFLNSSAGLIGDSGKYEWKIVEDGTLQSSTTEDSMRVNYFATSSSSYNGLRATLYFNGRAFDGSSSESPPTIYGNYTSYNSGNFRMGTFAGGWDHGEVVSTIIGTEIGGLKFAWHSGDMVKYDIAHYGMVNNR